MNRTIKKQVWFNEKEDRILKDKARKTCLTEAALIRLLVLGYEPREKPDERFYAFTKELSRIGNNLNQLAAKANRLGSLQAGAIEEELRRLHHFQANMEAEFLTHGRSE